MGSQRGGTGVTGSQKKSAAAAFRASASGRQRAKRSDGAGSPSSEGGGGGGGGGAGGTGGGGAGRAADIGGIVGQVVDARGKGVADTSVAIEDGVQSAKTDTRGEFEITGVPAGSVVIRATRKGYLAATRTVNVRRGRVARVRVTLQGS